MTIVHACSLPLNEAYPDKFRLNILNRLRELGVRIILEDVLDIEEPSEGGEVVTRRGTVIQADLVVSKLGRFLKRPEGWWAIPLAEGLLLGYR